MMPPLESNGNAARIPYIRGRNKPGTSTSEVTMAKVVVPDDCGNSPRKALIKDINVAFAENDAEFVLDHLTDDAVMEMVGDERIEGKTSIREALEQMADMETVEMVVEHVITHGKTAAANGTMKLAGGDQFGFCDVYVFDGHGKNAKIEKLTSYVVGMTSE